MYIYDKRMTIQGEFNMVKSNKMEELLQELNRVPNKRNEEYIN